MSWNVVAVVLAAEDEANCKDGRVECGKESLSVTAPGGLPHAELPPVKETKHCHCRVIENGLPDVCGRKCSY